MAENRLKQLRREADRTGVQLAERLGISSPYYYDMERGRRNIAEKYANKLAQIYDVSIPYLLGHSDERGRSSDNTHADFDYYEALNTMKELATNHGYELRDPNFLDILNKALSLVQAILKEKKS